jgi:hypothetical protein
LLATYKRRINSTNSGATIRVGCKREDILNISWEEYASAAKDAVKGLVLANEFLLSQYIFDSKFLPYGSQLIPLSAIFAILGNEADTHAAQEKISRWYWSGVLGELYGGAIETRFGLDLPEVVSWVRGSKDIPRTVGDANFASARLLTLNSRLSAAYKGIYALMLRNGALDWIKGTPMTIATYFDSKVDIHHIFPKAWCNSQGIKPREYNSIINKTPISARTNRSIGGVSPSKYLEKIIESGKVSSQASLVASVESHAVKYSLLNDDDYYGFYENRKMQLISLIEKALGKPVQISHSDSDEVYQDSEVEDDED